MTTTDYVIPEKVKDALKFARNVVIRPADGVSRFPRIIVVIDGERLPTDPEELKQATDKLYKTLFDHVQSNNNSLDVFRCNATSRHLHHKLRTARDIEALETSLPLPHQQSSEPPENYYLKPDYVVRIENNCDDQQENENFLTIGQAWKAFVKQQKQLEL